MQPAGMSLGMRHGKWVVAGLLLIGVGLLGSAIAAGWTRSFDLALARLLSLQRGQSPDWLIAGASEISWVGGGPQRTAIVVMIALTLWRWRGLAVGAAMALTSLGSNLASEWLKHGYARPRPQLVPHLDDIGASLSYPSGHATSAAVVYLLLALVLPPERRRLWLWLAAGLALLTGLSRIMLGVHYPSDVAGGWMLGAAFALIGAALLERRGVAGPPSG